MEKVLSTESCTPCLKCFELLQQVATVQTTKRGTTLWSQLGNWTNTSACRATHDFQTLQSLTSTHMEFVWRSMPWLRSWVFVLLLAGHTPVVYTQYNVQVNHIILQEETAYSSACLPLVPMKITFLSFLPPEGGPCPQYVNEPIYSPDWYNTKHHTCTLVWKTFHLWVGEVKRNHNFCCNVNQCEFVTWESSPSQVWEACSRLIMCVIVNCVPILNVHFSCNKLMQRCKGIPMILDTLPVLCFPVFGANTNIFAWSDFSEAKLTFHINCVILCGQKLAWIVSERQWRQDDLQQHKKQWLTIDITCMFHLSSASSKCYQYSAKVRHKTTYKTSTCKTNLLNGSIHFQELKKYGSFTHNLLQLFV